MKANAFLTLVRQYASLAKRMNVSYQAQVDVLVAQRVATIQRDENDPAVAGALVQATHDIAQREYSDGEAVRLPARYFQDET